ncbi:hypothetical protein AX16_004815 [Volvariella volvacea WC 439]|nr:hypothetical protein AX16_004815 [Volvariella volvacea WC 439]
MEDYQQHSPPTDVVLRETAKPTEAHIWGSSHPVPAMVTAPINTLCPDILSTIFLIVAQSVDWVFWRYVEQVSHICRYWRAVALDTPRLWNRLTFKGPKFQYEDSLALISELQKRSKSVPLHVKLLTDVRTGDGVAIANVIREAFPDFLRVGSLDMSCNYNLLMLLLSPYADTPNPIIQHLFVSVSIPGGDSNVPFKLFGDCMPNLRSLDIRKCQYNWQIVSSFRSLESLRMSFVGSNSLATFALLPRLKHLHLEGPQHLRASELSEAGVQTATTSTLAVIGSLQSLTLCGVIKPRQAISMLSHISLPACMRFSLDITCTSRSDQDYLDLLSCLSRLVAEGSRLSHIPIHCLSLTPSEIVAKAWDDWESLPVDGREDHRCPPVHLKREQAQVFVLRLYRPERMFARPPRPILEGMVVRSLVDLFNLQRLHSLVWRRETTVFIDAKVELDCSFFDQLMELRNIEVQESSWRRFKGILPTMDLVSAETQEENTISNFRGRPDSFNPLVLIAKLHQLQLQLSPEPKYCTSCPNLSNVTRVYETRG